MLGDEDEVKERETKQEYNLLCDWIKQQLGDKVAKVQVSKRLSSSPCVLVSGKFGWSANMERLVYDLKESQFSVSLYVRRWADFSVCRLMKAQALGDTSSLEFMRGRRILEINPDHPIVKDLNVRLLFYRMLIHSNDQFKLIPKNSSLLLRTMEIKFTFKHTDSICYALSKSS